MLAKRAFQTVVASIRSRSAVYRNTLHSNTWIVMRYSTQQGTSSNASENASGNASEEERIFVDDDPAFRNIPVSAFRRYLLLTSRNRGRVETELFLGGYAMHQDRIWNMTVPELLQYKEVLEYTDNELFEYIVGQVEPPEDLKRNPEFQRIVQYVRERGSRHYSDPERKTFDDDFLKSDCSPPTETKSA